MSLMTVTDMYGEAMEKDMWRDNYYTDRNNRPNKRNRTISSWNDDNDENGDFDNEEDDGNLRLDKTNEFIRVCLSVCRGA